MRTFCFILLLAFGTAYAADEDEAKASVYYKSALSQIPEGAEIIRIIGARKKTSYNNTYFVFYDFERNCYMLMSGTRTALIILPACG